MKKKILSEIVLRENITQNDILPKSLLKHLLGGCDGGGCDGGGCDGGGGCDTGNHSVCCRYEGLPDGECYHYYSVPSCKGNYDIQPCIDYKPKHIQYASANCA